ncbi:MAG: hypothetical protein HYZ00_08495, partial [Candidatus Hydrogenedentes bacterium]|nr:hypothetical protein [Candidatus Hydrogenedentota bacterium]
TPDTGPSSAERFGFKGMPAAGQPAAQPQFTWTKPEPWTELPSTSLRLANFQAGSEGNVECYLSVLPGGAGGIEANLNRWRKQMGLALYTPEEVAALPKLPVLGHEAVVGDMTGTFTGMSGDQNNPNYRMLGAILEHGGAMVFVKMVGPAEAVAAERENFDAFVASLKAGETAAQAGNLPPGHPPLDAAQGQDMPHAAPEHAQAEKPQLEWIAPEGWQQAGGKPMRLVSFKVGEGGQTECYVTVLGGDAGGIEANVNLWRQQMSQAALTAPELEQLPKIDILGKPSTLVEVEGSLIKMDGAIQENAMMIGAICPLEGRTIFVKMTGPAEEVKAQKDNFVAFCQSLKEPPASVA